MIEEIIQDINHKNLCLQDYLQGSVHIDLRELTKEAVNNDFQTQGLKGRYTSIRSGGDFMK